MYVYIETFQHNIRKMLNMNEIFAAATKTKLQNIFLYEYKELFAFKIDYLKVNRHYVLHKIDMQYY